MLRKLCTAIAAVLILVSCTGGTSPDPHEVVFYSDGTEYSRVVIQNGSALSQLSPPEKVPAGKAGFMYWSLVSDEKQAEPYDFTKPVTDDMTLYATWGDISISYLNGSTAIHTAYALRGSSLSDPGLVPSAAEGKIFSHWSLSPNGTEYQFGNPVSSSIELHAVFKDKTFTVRFIDGINDEERTVVYGDTVSIPPAPSIPGRIFRHWSTVQNGTAFDFSTGIKSDLTLYAVWDVITYKITIDDGSTTTTQVVVEGKTAIRPADPPSGEGRTFVCWSTQPDGGPYDFSSIVRNSFTLYAVWDYEEHDVGFYVDDKLYESETVRYGSCASVPDEPHKQGKEFLHWSQTPGGASPYDFTTPVKNDMRLYAVFQDIVYTITFNDNGAMDTVRIRWGELLDKPEDPSIQGKRFICWSTQQNGSTPYDFTRPVYSSFTLYAVYEDQAFEVRFHDGNAVITSKVVYGETAEAIVPETPEGKRFLCWSAEEGGSAFDFNTPVFSDVDLYAVYEDIRFSVTYINDDIMETESVVYGEKAPDKAVAVPADSIFRYWSESINGEPFDFSSGIYKDTTLYAVIEPRMITVVFDYGGTQEIAKVQYGKAIEKPQDPVDPEGHGFLYWSTQPDGTEYDFNTKVTEGITLYAVWDAFMYTVTFVSKGEVVAVESVKEGSLVSAPSVSESPGDELLAWIDDTGNAFSFDSGVHGNHTLKAVWSSDLLVMDGSTLIDIRYTGIEELEIPDSVTCIGERALEGCSQLSAIDIPASVTKVEAMAFSGCSSLQTIRFHGDVDVDSSAFSADKGTIQEIQITSGMNAASIFSSHKASIRKASVMLSEHEDDIDFHGFSALESITLPDGIISIGQSAFSGCSGLGSIAIPEGVTAIGSYAFRNSGIESIKLPSTLESLGENAFELCSRLKSIEIPNGITAISNNTFAGCSGLVSVVLPDEVTSIGEYAFDECEKLSSINFPSTLKAIGNRAFEHCMSLKTVDLPDGITELGEYIFFESGIESFRMPENWTVLPGGIFTGCLELTDIEFNSIVNKIDYYALCDTGLRELVIPETVESFGGFSLAFNDYLERIELPDNLVSLGTYICYYNHALKEITIPAGVTYIYRDSFTHCENLGVAYILNPTTVIENGAFNTSVTRIVWPNGQDTQG